MSARIDGEKIEQRLLQMEEMLERALAETTELDGNILNVYLPKTKRDIRTEDTTAYSLKLDIEESESKIKKPYVFSQSPFAEMSIDELQSGYVAQSFSVEDVIISFLSEIDKLNPKIKAFSEVFNETALKEARALDKELMAGVRPFGLFGIPIGIKDNIDIKGHKTTLGSSMYADNLPASKDSEIVFRLKEKKAIILGKHSTHELAFGPTSDSPFHGPVRNPYLLECVSGGSSGGSASAVSAGISTISVGTDTGGSIRIPSAFCGLFGLKPTQGCLPLDGVWGLAYSLDNVGPITRSVGDLMHTFMAMQDNIGAENLADTIHKEMIEARRLTIGIPSSWIKRNHIHDCVWNKFEDAIGKLRLVGMKINFLQENILPDISQLINLNRFIIMAEGAAQYSHLLHCSNVKLTSEIEDRLKIGMHISAYSYINSQKIRKKLTEKLILAMRDVDVMMLPTVPTVAPKIGATRVPLSGDITEDLHDALVRFTSPFNITGHPTLSLPTGYAQSGLPVSAQVIGKYHREVDLFKVAATLSENNSN